MVLKLIVLIAFTTPLSAYSGELNFEAIEGARLPCKELAEDLTRTIRLESFSAPRAMVSDSQLEIEFVLSKSDALSQEEWIEEHSFVSFNSIIKKPYTKYVRHKPALAMKDFFFGPNSEQQFKLSTSVAKNIGGIATHRLTFSLMHPEFSWCIIIAFLGYETEITSTELDITPPLVRDIKFDKLSYQAGEEVKALYTLTEPLKKAESNHIDFINRNIAQGESNRSIPKFDYEITHKLKRVSDTVYEFAFQIPPDQPAGSYYPGFFNRFDDLGNFEDKIGKEDLFEKRIAETASFVIIDKEHPRVDEDIESLP